MNPLHELVRALAVLAHEGWTPAECNAPELARQVRELEAQQAQVAEALHAAEDALTACIPDGTDAARERWLRAQRRATSTRLQLAALSQAEVYLRSEIERELWQAMHRRAARDTRAVAA